VTAKKKKAISSGKGLYSQKQILAGFAGPAAKKRAQAGHHPAIRRK